MLLKNRIYKRKEASKDAKLFIVFTEGKKREPVYFKYFNEISSQIRLEIVPTDQHDNNSPTGLYDTAVSKLIKSPENPTPKYETYEDDEVWFIIDTDTWKEKIQELKEKCSNHNNWYIAQSNPCFEVWLYYHFNDNIPKFDGIEQSKKWKTFVNNRVVKGGFDSRRHPVYINTAIKNSKKTFQEKENMVRLACTDVFKLAEKFYPLVKEEIEEVLSKLAQD